MHKRIAIVGGSCVDVFATSALPLIRHDSNPGAVNIGFGGVGRNIAENLARLGQEAILFAPFGSDPFSRQMLAYTSAAGVITEHAVISPQNQAPYYISINDSSGDMDVAISDLAICTLITPQYLADNIAVLNQCDAVIVDTNIPKESVTYLAANCTSLLFAEAVSTRKAEKLQGILPHLFVLKTNLHEAGSLLHTPLTAKPASLKTAANRFHDLGISYVLITLGAQGAFLSNHSTQIIMQAFPVKTVNANGCGDAFGAAAFNGIVRSLKPTAILRQSLAAAAITAQSAQAVSSHISSDALQVFLNESRK